MVEHTRHPSTQETEDQEVEASLGYIISLFNRRNIIHISKTLNNIFLGVGYVPQSTCVKEGNSWGSVLFFQHVRPGVNLRSSRFVARTFAD